MSNLELLDRAASAATCQVLGVAGSRLVGAGAVSLWAAGTGFVPITAGALSLLAANYLCPDMEMGGTPPVPGIDGCQQMEPDGYGQLEWSYTGESWTPLPAGASADKTTAITRTEVSAYNPDRGYASLVYYTTTTQGDDYGWTTVWCETEAEAAAVKYRINPTTGGCAIQGGEPNPIPPEAYEPIEYTDNVTNCTYNVSLQGFAQESEHGTVQPVYLVEGATQQRFDGGRMGGCNFPPTIHMPGGGGGGGGYNFPVPSPLPDPGDGVPWWAGPLLGAAAGAGLKLIGDELARLSEADFEEGSFTMVAPCDYDENGEPQYRTWEFQKASFQQRMNAHQVALMEMLQQHLDWKTPTCGDGTFQPGEGDWRTIGFISDHVSPYGRDRLRKRLRYRSKSGWTDDAIVDHWKDFVFEAGPIRVDHLGAPWGAPQVWAASADEGKRVIRHAAGEAGFDPDQTGRWSVGGSRSPRLGVSDTMRVRTTGGYYWITARDGSDNRPLVKLTDPGSGVE